MSLLKIADKTKEDLWWLIISVDYDYSRISIADHELNDGNLTLWLEDKEDFKNSIDECLQLEISKKQFEKIIRAENLNAYEGVQMHPVKNYLQKAWIEIAKPIEWYSEEATTVQQQWAREAVIKAVLTQLVETESGASIW